VSETMIATRAQVERLTKDRDKAKADLRKLEEETQELRDRFYGGVLAPDIAARVRREFSKVPGLGGLHTISRVATVSETLAIVTNMAEIMQGLFDKVQEMETQRDRTDSMLAGAGELLLTMTEAAHQRRARQQGGTV